MTSDKVSAREPGWPTGPEKKPVSPAVLHRIQRTATPLQWLFEQIRAWLRRRLVPREERRLAPWASAVYAADAGTLARTPRSLPGLRMPAEGDTRQSAGQISVLFDVRLQQRVHLDCRPQAGTGCQWSVLTLVEHVQAGALLLFDRGSLSIACVDTLCARGIWWISRPAHQARYHVMHICYQAHGVLDAVVSLGTSSGNRACSPVRLIQFYLHGRCQRYLTNVLDPHVLPLTEVIGLYARRWESELALRASKNHPPLRHEWSAQWAVVQVQVWCYLILARVYHTLQAEAAGQAEDETIEVSLDVLVSPTPDRPSRGLTPLEDAVRFGRDLGLIRLALRERSEVPHIDPCRVVPPPPEAVQPRERVRSRFPRGAGLLGLKAGKLPLVQ